MLNRNISSRMFDIINFIFLTLFFLVILYPLLYVVSSSFSSPAAIIGGQVTLLPVGFTLNGYKAVFKNSQVWLGFRNSLFYAVAITALNLFMTTLAAYPLSRKDFRVRNGFMYFFAFTMFFNAGLLPYYIVIRTLGMVNKPWVMFIPGAMSVFNVILMRTFIQSSIPDSIRESTQIDGCCDFRYLFSFVVPLSKPILAVVAIYVAVESWNDYFMALVFLTSQKLQPIQIILRNILVLNNVSQEMMSTIRDVEALRSRMGLQVLLKYSLIVVSSLPMLVLYPFIQKFFTKGIFIGSIKG